MSAPNMYYIEILNGTIVYLCQYILPIFYILGNIGNVLSVLIFMKKSWRKNVCVCYFNVCLFFNSCYINSSLLGSIFTYGFNLDLSNSSVLLCKLIYYVSFFFSRIFPTILILASIDRLLISSQNVNTRLYSSKRLAYFSISLSTVFWMIFYFHVLIKVDIQRFTPLIFACYFDRSQVYLEFISYSAIFIQTFTVLIMFVLSILAFKNVRHLRTIPRQPIRSMNRKDFQLLRCLFAQDIIYILFNLVLTVSIVYGAARKYQTLTVLEQKIDNFVFNLGTFLHHIPYCSSFMVFICVSKAFRHELKRMVSKLRGNERSSRGGEEENRQGSVERNEMKVNVVSAIVLAT